MSALQRKLMPIALSFARLWLASLFVAVFIYADVSVPYAAEPEAAVYFLLRHAEKDRSDPNDDNPNLTAAGHIRANDLARLLKDAGIKHIRSTSFKRTQQTAAPLATQFNLQVMGYEARTITDLQKLISTMRGLRGPQVIVGHSDTTHMLVELLGGEPGTEIQDDEFDRLYVVTGSPDTEVQTIQLRYGAVGP